MENIKRYGIIDIVIINNIYMKKSLIIVLVILSLSLIACSKKEEVTNKKAPEDDKAKFLNMAAGTPSENTNVQDDNDGTDNINDNEKRIVVRSLRPMSEEICIRDNGKWLSEEMSTGSDSAPILVKYCSCLNGTKIYPYMKVDCINAEACTDAGGKVEEFSECTGGISLLCRLEETACYLDEIIDGECEIDFSPRDECEADI